MNGPALRCVEIAAPAKLNLGLEVIGRREDGFHEVATIYLAVTLHDRLSLSEDPDLLLTCNEPSLVDYDNLALRALRALRDATGLREGARLELAKAIPYAAGLGGASSDAAAALRAARDLWQLDICDERLAEIAVWLGSDVPFFLQGGCALGRGRGELLAPLPPPRDVWFVIVVPAIEIPRKTATLYERLQVEDFSDSGMVNAQAERLRAGLPLDSALLGNAFARPLCALVPDLAHLPVTMHSAGAPIVAISGAGPAHYAVVPAPDEAATLADRLTESLGDRARVFVAAPCLRPTQPVASEPSVYRQ
jgi:4-diphosphocytidyl-2-C-methyl-D-erythritol kinase